MSANANQDSQASDFGTKLLYILTIIMVVVGLLNATPGFPGYDNLVSDLVGVNEFTLRKFPYEWFYPLFFALMMSVVALKHSMWRSWSDKSKLRRRFGLFMDIALVVMAFVIAGTYLIENDSICLIDQLNGDRGATAVLGVPRLVVPAAHERGRLLGGELIRRRRDDDAPVGLVDLLVVGAGHPALNVVAVRVGLPVEAGPAGEPSGECPLRPVVLVVELRALGLDLDDVRAEDTVDGLLVGPLELLSGQDGVAPSCCVGLLACHDKSPVPA